MEKLLSIIVPTKNRFIFLKYIIDIFVKIESDCIELLIEDNSDSETEIENLVEKYSDSRVKYYHIPEKRTVSENFTQGILHSNGKYVCMLGDDDAFSTRILEIAEYMKKHEIESAIFNKAFYKWPDYQTFSHKFKFLNVIPPSLTIDKCHGRIIEIDVQKELEKCLRRGAVSLGKMPEVYHGIVERKILNKIYHKCGTFFPGESPDMAVAAALSLVVKKHIYVDIPFTISGQCYSSAGGQGGRHQHKGDLKEKKFLSDNVVENWEKNIPLIWTPETIYADSFHKALKNMGREKLLEKFNYTYNYAKYRRDNQDLKSHLSSIIQSLNWQKKINYFTTYYFLYCQKLIDFVAIQLKKLMKLQFKNVFCDIKDSSEAEVVVTAYITKLLISLK